MWNRTWFKTFVITCVQSISIYPFKQTQCFASVRRENLSLCARAQRETFQILLFQVVVSQGRAKNVSNDKMHVQFEKACKACNRPYSRWLPCWICSWISCNDKQQTTQVWEISTITVINITKSGRFLPQQGHHQPQCYSKAMHLIIKR